MFIAYDIFGFNESSIMNTQLAHSQYGNLNITGGVIDDIFIDRDITIPFTTTKPSEWNYSTVIYAKLQNNLEGGSAEAMGLEIERIKFQKRASNSLEWIDVGELEYLQGDPGIYEIFDKIIRNGEIYEYSLVPVTANVSGNRVISAPITAEFEGVFLNDSTYNYQLLYDIEHGEVNHNNPSAIATPLNAKYPIITYSNLDYIDFNVQATFISAQTILDQRANTQQVNIRMENLERENLLNFLKNRKPKIYKDSTGKLKLVTVTDNPKEIPKTNVEGVAALSIHLTEIAEINTDNLINYNLISSVSGDY